MGQFYWLLVLCKPTESYRRLLVGFAYTYYVTVAFTDITLFWGLFIITVVCLVCTQNLPLKRDDAEFLCIVHGHFLNPYIY